MKRYIPRLILLVTLFILPKAVEAEWRVVGDLNNDDKLSIADVIIFVSILNGQQECPTDVSALDLNKDSKVTTSDLQLLIERILKDEEPIRIWIPESVDIGGTGTFD